MCLRYIIAAPLVLAVGAASSQPLDVDVAIIGGGATGSYAAITLADMGKSVVVVEASSQLGGHTNTYTDPETSTAVDYGVQRFGSTTIAIDFFQRLGVSYTNDAPAATYNDTVYADFVTSRPINFVPTTNYTSYERQLDKYPYLLYTTDIPTPIPADLSLSFAEFVTKYSLQNAAFDLAELYGLSLLNQTVLTVIAESGLSEFSLSPSNTVRIVDGNQQIYAKALQELGSSVLLNSTVANATRSSSSSSFVVKTPGGDKHIFAKRTLITIPTTATNMAPFAPDAREQALFSQFSGPGLWVGLIKVAGLAPATEYVNAGVDTLYHIPALPAVTSLIPTAIKGVYRFLYFDDTACSTVQAEQRVLAYVKRFAEGVSGKTEHPRMVAFASHSPFKVGLSAQAIQNDGWAKMYDLQGHRGTWYTGVQFLAGSTQLWNYTSTLIPSIVAGL